MDWPTVCDFGSGLRVSATCHIHSHSELDPLRIDLTESVQRLIGSGYERGVSPSSVLL